MDEEDSRQMDLVGDEVLPQVFVDAIDLVQLSIDPITFRPLVPHGIKFINCVLPSILTNCDDVDEETA